MSGSKNFKTARTFVYVLLAITTVLAAAYTVFNIISLLNDPYTSFPWWSAFGFTAVYFLPFLIPEIAFCVIFSILYNKRARAEKADKKA